MKKLWLVLWLLFLLPTADLHGAATTSCVTVPQLSDVVTVVNVKCPPYNAKGDGSTDDAAAIQAAADAAATAQGTLYFPLGVYRVTSPIMFPSDTFAGGGQNHFNIQGDGYVQSVINCDIASSTSDCITFWGNKGFSMKGMAFHNAQTKGSRQGLVFSGSGSGTQTGQSIFELVAVDSFSKCINTQGVGGTATSSEMTFINLFLGNCTDGFYNGNFNGLNFVFIQLMMAENTTGINCATAGCYVMGGSASANGTDFLFTNGGTSTVMNFRSESIGTYFLDMNGTNVFVKGVLAHKTGSTEVIRSGGSFGSSLTIESSEIGGYITAPGSNFFATEGLTGIVLLNNRIADVSNDVIRSNTGATTDNMGPGFRSSAVTSFMSHGNMRCTDGTFSTCDERFVDGIGTMTGAGTSQPIYNSSERMIIDNFKTTGAAGGKKVLCVDTSTGRLYASSTGTDCSN